VRVVQGAKGAKNTHQSLSQNSWEDDFIQGLDNNCLQLLNHLPKNPNSNLISTGRGFSWNMLKLKGG
jgi:hypothetical protein